MIAIVGHLVIKLIRSRMQFQHPVQTPARFIEHVGDAVGTRLAQVVNAICKLRRAQSISH